LLVEPVADQQKLNALEPLLRRLYACGDAWVKRCNDEIDQKLWARTFHGEDNPLPGLPYATSITRYPDRLEMEQLAKQQQQKSPRLQSKPPEQTAESALVDSKTGIKCHVDNSHILTGLLALTADSANEMSWLHIELADERVLPLRLNKGDAVLFPILRHVVLPVARDSLRVTVNGFM